MQKKILICGFSGSGKSTALKIIRDWDQEGRFNAIQDLDSRILKNSKPKFKTIQEMVENLGWDEFRKKERAEFESFLKEESPAALSLGGGTLTPLLWELYGGARNLKWIHVSAPFEVCFERLKLDQDSEPRPLLKLGELELRRLFQSREEIFRKIQTQWNNTGAIGELRSQVVTFLEEFLS
jgi:shikimate kinase